MEQHAATHDTLRRATQCLQQLLLRTPDKSPQTAAREAEAIAHLAFLDGHNPVRELFLAATPRTEPAKFGARPEDVRPMPGQPSTGFPERPRSPSPSATIRPKSSKAFFKFGRGRDKSGTLSGSSSAAPKQSNIDGVSPLFEQCFGPIEEKRPKRKERVSDVTPPSSSTAAAAAAATTSKGVPVTSFPSQQKPPRVYEQYKCIVCDAELSSKGVCKRHLEEQHIKPKVYECEGCHAYFDTKAEAKKHCSQCGAGDLSFITTQLAKKVYACEYTGGYYSGQARYTEHLLMLSEQKDPRPVPNLNSKLDAILRHAGHRHAALTPLVCEISQSLFGSHDAWKDLQWDEDYLRAKITVLEHATFNDDGTVESTRWSGSSPRRRNTKSYLTQLFQAGRLPSQGTNPNHIKPAPMSICSTPAPLSRDTPSVASGPSRTDTPRRMMSPTSRSQSRQTAWSQDAMDHSTTASTPRSGDDIMTAELKSKRHLSDESRAYIPARTPPGPPEPPDHYQYQHDPSMLGQAPQIPPLPAFLTPSNSTISLPLRKPENDGLAPPHQTMVSAPQYAHPLYHMPPSHASSHTLISDVASETSTLAQSYREPELTDAIPMDYHLWQQQQQQQQQQFAFQNGGVHPAYPPYSGFDYSIPDDASLVASSVNTGHTIGVEYVSELPKMESFPDIDMSGHPHPHQHHSHPHAHVGTFYLPPDSAEEQQGH